MAMPADVEVALARAAFGEKEREAVRYGGLSASVFRYDSGVEALRLSNARGGVVVLPYLGQMVWSATFDGVELAMESMFKAPRPARNIVETYGCLAFHSGLLRNGVPGAGDTHELHGEAPCAPMDAAGVTCGTDERGAWIAATGSREYAVGFGGHYIARPRVVLREGATSIEIAMSVTNLSAAPMDLMYMCHVNFAFARGARVVQSLPFTPDHVIVRTAIPGFVTPSDDYRALLAELATHPARMQRLDEPDRYDPEQVFYIKGLPRQAPAVSCAIRHAAAARATPSPWPTIRWRCRIRSAGCWPTAISASPPSPCRRPASRRAIAAELRKGQRSLAWPAGPRRIFRPMSAMPTTASAHAAVHAIEGHRGDDGAAAIADHVPAC